MNVLVVEPGMAPYEKEVNGLEEMQATVGGLITASYPYEEPVAIVSNDESILEGRSLLSSRMGPRRWARVGPPASAADVFHAS